MTYEASPRNQSRHPLSLDRRTDSSLLIEQLLMKVSGYQNVSWKLSLEKSEMKTKLNINMNRKGRNKK